MVVPNQTYALTREPYQEHSQYVLENDVDNARGETNAEGCYVSVLDLDGDGAVEHDNGDFVFENIDDAW